MTARSSDQQGDSSAHIESPSAHIMTTWRVQLALNLNRLHLHLQRVTTMLAARRARPGLTTPCTAPAACCPSTGITRRLQSGYSKIDDAEAMRNKESCQPTYKHMRIAQLRHGYCLLTARIHRLCAQPQIRRRSSMYYRKHRVDEIAPSSKAPATLCHVARPTEHSTESHRTNSSDSEESSDADSTVPVLLRAAAACTPAARTQRAITTRPNPLHESSAQPTRGIATMTTTAVTTAAMRRRHAKENGLRK